MGRRRTSKRWVPEVREKVAALRDAELRKFVSPVFEELNWAFSSDRPLTPSPTLHCACAPPLSPAALGCEMQPARKQVLGAVSQ